MGLVHEAMHLMHGNTGFPSTTSKFLGFHELVIMMRLMHEAMPLTHVDMNFFFYQYQLPSIDFVLPDRNFQSIVWSSFL
ncbi:hypothetical protein MTR_3g052090 [Medicago truncatula]|nr:hypothetical protein MTR_3g052090 [Medicago truncatula]